MQQTVPLMDQIRRSSSKLSDFGISFPIRRSRPEPPKFLRISNCHDFAWSRSLWRDASLRIIATAMGALIIYVVVASLLAYSDGLRGVDIVYFISASVNTVGLGDISPQSQFHRAASVITLPFGLVILSLCLAANEAWSKTSKRKPDDEEDDVFVDVSQRRKNKSKRHMERWVQWSITDCV
jgi:hypothetical protein